MVVLTIGGKTAHLRDSGVPFTIVLPCALTEEPGGANLEFDQGDNIKGKISRDDVADICLVRATAVKTVANRYGRVWHGATENDI